jgi:hypothetical protein
MQKISQREFFYLALLLIAIIGIISIVNTTQYGIGLGSDSVVYIAAARNLIEGSGVSWVSGSGSIQPMNLHAPFFSILLAGFEVVSIDGVEGARILSSIAFGLDIFLVGLITYQIIRSKPFSLVSSVILLLTGELLEIHSWAMSDQVYITLSLASIFLLLIYFDDRKRLYLILAAVFASLAALTRYIGISIILAGGVSLIIDRSERYSRRLKNAIIYSLISILPISVWLLRNLLRTGLMTGRYSVWNPDALQGTFLSSLSIVLNWFLPLRLVSLFLNQDIWVIILGILLGIGLAVLASIGLVKFHDQSESIQVDASSIAVLFGYVIFYFAVLFITAVTANPASDIIQRILLPIYPVLLIILVWFLFLLWKTEKLIIKVLIVVLIVFLIRNKAVYSYWISRGLDGDGQRYSSRAWQSSETIEKLAELNPKMVYTDDIAAVYILADMKPILIPLRLSPATRFEKSNVSEALSNMKNNINENGGVLVLFSPSNIAEEFVSLDDLTAGLVPIVTTQDGVIYGSQ